jgi:hypothetical protein
MWKGRRKKSNFLTFKNGQLGNGLSLNFNYLQKISGYNGVTQIAAGGLNSFFIKDGYVYAFGSSYVFLFI